MQLIANLENHFQYCDQTEVKKIIYADIKHVKTNLTICKQIIIQSSTMPHGPAL